MRIAKRWPVDPGRRLQGAGEALGCQVGERDGDEHRRPAPEEREPERDHQPDGTPRPDARQPDEDVVEWLRPMLDDPALPVTVERGQMGTICFAWSIRCCRSKGFPTKPRAPLEAASACA